MNDILFAFIVSCILLVSSRVQAQDQDTPGTSDHPLISRYSGSIIDGYEIQTYNSFSLPTGPTIRDADGEMVPSEKVDLEGKITRILYRGPEGRTTLEIFRNYKSALEQAGFEILFECTDTDCGRLFQWPLYRDRKITNTKTSGNAFDVPKDIRYLAAKKAMSSSTIHMSILIAIDNIWTKKPVTLLEVIESEAMDTDMVTINADLMAERIEATGHVSIYGIYFDTNSSAIKEESEPILKEINTLLKQNPSLNLYIVGHTDNQGGYAYNMELSQKRSESVVRSLTEKYGITSSRLTSAGVGFLSPVATNDKEEGRAQNRRVELVKN
jgi:OOP family OmpA-OmpF porin